MRSPILLALAAAVACGLLVGGEATAFAWTIDLVLMERLGLGRDVAVIAGLAGIGFGLAASLWVALKVYRAELALTTAMPAPAQPSSQA